MTPPSISYSRLLLAAAVIGLLTEMFYGIIVPILPDLRVEYGVDASHIGLLLAAQAFAMAVLALPLGWLGDRLGRRWPLIVLGMGLLALSSQMVAQADTFGMLVVSRLLQGSAAAAILPSLLAAISEQAPASHRGEALGWVTGAEGFGTVIGPLIGGGLFEIFGIHRSFTVIAVSLALVGLPLALAFRRPRFIHIHDSLAPAYLPPPQRAGTALMGLGVLALATSTMAILEVVGTLRLRDELNMGQLGLGILFLFLGLIFAAIQPLVGRFTDYHGRWTPVRWGLGALTLLLFVGAFVDRWSFVAVIMLMVPAVALVFAPVAPLIGDEAGVSKGFGRAYGIMHVAFALGYIIGPILGGQLLHMGGASFPGLPMIVASAISALTLVLLLLWLHLTPHPPTPPLLNAMTEHHPSRLRHLESKHPQL